MHKIKRQAHRAGWYSDNDDSWGRNFITGRFKPKYPTDEENQLRPIATETDASSPIEDNRRSKAIEESADFHGPNKSSTFPQGPSGYLPGERADISSSSDHPYSEKPSDELEKTTNTTSTDGAELTASSTEDAKPRRRKWNPFSKKEAEVEQVTRADTEDTKKTKRRPKLTVMSQLKAVFGSWINILLVFVPVGIALNYAHVNEVVVFVINFIAIIPLAAVLSYSTEELALYIGEVLGGLLNATFGNAVELIVSIIALVQGKVLIVQTSLIGSMLSNLLLVLGMCFFFGGVNRVEQHFNVTVAQTAASLLALSIGGLIIPTAFFIFSPNRTDTDPNNDDYGVAPASRGTAVLLLVVYGCYLLFQLRTHVDMYNEPSQKVAKRSTGRKDVGEASKGIAMIGAASGAATAGGGINKDNLVHEEEEEEETPSLTVVGAVITLAVSTVFIALCAEYMVSAITVVGRSISQEFIGLILLPIVGNAAEHVTAVTVAIKDKMDLSIGVAIGSSLQIALLVLPVMVLLNWWGVGLHADGGYHVLTLNFDGFLVVVLVISIWLVNYLIADGKSHWLEGILLMITYLIIAVAAWFYPVDGEVAG